MEQLGSLITRDSHLDLIYPQDCLPLRRLPATRREFSPEPTRKSSYFCASTDEAGRHGFQITDDVLRPQPPPRLSSASPSPATFAKARPRSPSSTP